MLRKSSVKGHYALSVRLVVHCISIEQQ
jgi:hypothetical protein